MITDAARPAPVPLGDYENRAILDAARSLPPPRASDIIILALVPDFCLRCPNCQFLDDRIRPECHVCGVIFAKWSKRTAPVPEPESGFWGWVDVILDLVLGNPRKLAVFAAAMAVLWVADGPRRLHAPVAPIAPGAWKPAGPLSYRIGYLKPEGMMGTLPIYHEGDRVGYILRSKTSARGRSRASESSRSRKFPGGEPNRPKPCRTSALRRAPTPGREAAQFHGVFTVAGFNTTGSHTEFTHLTFDQRGSTGELFTSLTFPTRESSIPKREKVKKVDTGTETGGRWAARFFLSL